jgi:hypothetical protein
MIEGKLANEECIHPDDNDHQRHTDHTLCMGVTKPAHDITPGGKTQYRHEGKRKLYLQRDYIYYKFDSVSATVAPKQHQSTLT